MFGKKIVKKTQEITKIFLKHLLIRGAFLVFRTSNVIEIKQETMYVEQRKKPKHDKGEMEKMLVVVRFLNSKFKRSYFDKKQKITPFKLYWTFAAKWYIVCSNHYVWSDDKRFKTFKKTIPKQFPSLPIQFCFQTDRKVFLDEKIFAIK